MRPDDGGGGSAPGTGRPMDPIAELFRREHFGMKFGLENIQALCEALGRPERACPTVIVAGTNGKGSVTAMTAAALSAAGHRTARYTSPHLTRLEERFAVDGVPAPRERVARAAAAVLQTERRMLDRGDLVAPVTFFELTTAIGFHLFREAAADVAVLEVGLGGRFDATNVVRPLAGAITTIDLEHTRYLGSTIPEIAFEKAGIIKPAMRVVVGERKPEALTVFRRACDERGATLVPAFDGVRADVRLHDGRTLVRLATPAHDYGQLTLGLRGRHQADNAMVAARLLEALDVLGLSVGPEAIRDGLTTATWPGRLEAMRDARGRTVLLDAAHNPAGIGALVAYLVEVHPGRVPVVFGAMRDKDVADMLRRLAPCATRLFLTQPSNPRAYAASDLARLAGELGLPAPVEAEADPLRAIDRALGDADLAVVTGSIFLVGDVRPHMSPAS